MSAGPFVLSRYESFASGERLIYPIRVQPETLLATIAGTPNAAPTDAVDVNVRVRVSGSIRASGLRARRITIRLPLTGQPTGYAPGGVLTIPALTAAFFNAAATIGIGGTVTYLTVACILVGADPRETSLITPIIVPA